MALTTRLFVIGATCVFAMIVVHNALNLDIPGRESRRRDVWQPMGDELGGGPRAHRIARRMHERGTAGGSLPAHDHAAGLRGAPKASDRDSLAVVPWQLPTPAPPNFTDCRPRIGQLGPTRALEYIVPPDAPGFPANCDREDLKELCGVVSRVAINREVLTAVCNSKIIGQLENFLQAVDSAGIKNVMIIALDQALCDWLDKRGVAYYKKISTAAGSHKISAQKFRIVREFLEVGCSVLMSDIDIVWIRNPFEFMWRDTDLEGATDGWDEETAYGWTEHLTDETAGGDSRRVDSYRITAFNSGLWYLQATHGGLRMMQLLAHRMETENTWDQTAFSQEASLPTHGDWLNAGITVRVMNHMCFCNSKTLLRAIRPDPALQAHRPVVVHVNYHQGKERYMVDINDRYHKGVAGALDRTAANEPRAVRSIAEVEAPYWTELNDGFVSGMHVKPTMDAVAAAGCAPQRPLNAFLARKMAAVEPDCASSPQQRALCDALAAAARSGEVALLYVTPANAGLLPLFAEAAAAAKVQNVLAVVREGAEDAARGAGVPTVPASSVLSAESAAFPPAQAKYALLRQALVAGFGVLLLEPSAVLLSDPFAALYRDSDIESPSAGWDDPSAYGYNHVLDDPTMGFTRYCHGSRIVARDPAMLFAMPSPGAVRFAGTIVRRLRDAGGAKTERQAVSEELWLPSSPAFARAGAIPRVQNYLCFTTARVLWRTINRLPSLRASFRPVVVLVPNNAEGPARMRAIIDRYVSGVPEALDKFTVGETMPEFSEEVCRAARQAGKGGAPGGAAEGWLRTLTSSTWSWAGVKPLTFAAHGSMSTPWGNGVWAVLPGKERLIAANFIGRQHVLLFTMDQGKERFVSSRCDDADVVLGRRVKEE